MPNIKHALFMANETKPTQPGAAEIKRQNSTSDYPMVDLREICDFVQRIREKGVESEAMPVVAKECGYSGPTSTGFWRRMAASRLFKLIEPQGSRLTGLALDYVEPDSDDAKTKSLRQAVRAVPGYQSLFDKYSGQRLNPEIIKNGIVRMTNLSDECALICAKVFVESLRFAGELDGDQTLLSPTRTPRIEAPADTDKNGTRIAAAIQPVPVAGDRDLETFYLTLDASKKRRVVVQAPPQVTRSELKRIQDWLSFQLLVEEPSAGEDQS